MEEDTVYESMIGKVFTKVERTNDTLTFENDEEQFVFYHEQDCCESVYIESIIGDLQDLVGVPLLMAEEVNNSENDLPKKNEYDDSYTWTFYKFATIKGYVDVRWYGESNGYYSESVHFKNIVKKKSKIKQEK